MTAEVILLAHGSPDIRAPRATHALAARVGEKLKQHVSVAFIDKAEPNLAVAVSAAVERGADRIVVVPLFLSRAFHVRVDVPEAVADAETATGVSIGITPPLGPDIRLLIEAPPDADGYVIATAGTSSVSAQKDFAALAQEFSAVTGAPAIAAYATQAQPTVEEAIAHLKAQGIAEPAVVSLVLFDGVLPDRIRESAGSLVCTPPLDRGTVLVDLVMERIRDCYLVKPTENGVSCEKCSSSCNRKEIREH